MVSRGALAAAAYRVEAAVEGDEGQRAAGVPERRARRPGVSRRVVRVHRCERRPADAALVAADDEETAVHDGRRGVVRRAGEWGPRLPAVGRGVVRLDRRDRLEVGAEAPDDDDPAVELGRRDFLARRRHRRQCGPRPRAHDVERRRRVRGPADA